MWYWLCTSHCVKRVCIRRYSGPHFPVFEQEQNPNTDTFHAVFVKKSADFIPEGTVKCTYLALEQIHRGRQPRGWCRVCGLWLCPNLEVRLRGDENVSLPLKAEKMHAFDIFTEKYLQWYGCSGTNFTVTVNGINSKTRIQIETI